MSEILRSVLMGLGCLSILGFVRCSMMGAGVIVAADRAADEIRADNARDNGEKSPWDK